MTNDGLLKLLLNEKDFEQLAKELSVTEPLSLTEIEKAKSGLNEILVKKDNALVCWYTIITLVDLGEENNELLEYLLSTAIQVISWLIEEGEKVRVSAGVISPAAIAGVMEFEVQMETIRALSRFKNSQLVGEIIKECFEGKILLGRQKSGGIAVLRKSALYAFGALGNKKYRGLVEYWATKAQNEDERKAAKAALTLWGRNYDEILECVKKEKDEKKGFFKKLFS